MMVIVDVHNSLPSLENKQKKDDSPCQWSKKTKEEWKRKRQEDTNRGKYEKKTLFVGGIIKIGFDKQETRSKMTEDILLKHFSNFGPIKDIEIIHSYSGCPPSFTFITYEN